MAPFFIIFCDFSFRSKWYKNSRKYGRYYFVCVFEQVFIFFLSRYKVERDIAMFQLELTGNDSQARNLQQVMINTSTTEPANKA